MHDVFLRRKKFFHLLETKGTIPKVRPDAACTNAAHATITAMVAASDGASAAPILPTSTHSTAPAVWTAQSTHSLPRIPNSLATASDATPPAGRAAAFIAPKVLQGEVEPFPEEVGRDVLHDELDAVAVAVGEREHPGAVVADASPHYLPEALPSLGSAADAGAPREIVGEGEDGEPRGDEYKNLWKR